MLSNTFTSADELTVDDHHDLGEIPIEEVPAQKDDLSTDLESIPDWFPYAQNPSAPVGQVEYVVCDQYIIKTLLSVLGTTLPNCTATSSAFFMHILKTFLKLVSNRLCYKEWTSPCLRRKIAFRVGKSPSPHATLLNGVLPTSRKA